MSELEVEIPAEERLENAEYDLDLAKRAWSGRSVEEIERDIEAARVRERETILSRVYADQVKAQLARFDLQKERTRALAVRACEAELEEAKRAEGIVL